MEQIIHQITAKFVKEFMEGFGVRGVYDLGGMSKEGFEMAKRLAKDLIGAVIEDAGKKLVAAKSQRRDDGIRIHERSVPRTQFTSLGSLTYGRAYFDSAAGKAYLLDALLGVDAYGRVDRTVGAAIVNASGIYSFGRSTDIVTGGRLGRQTAWNKAMGTGETVAVPHRVGETPETLHIFADEDHVHLQDGRSAILPLVTICAGKRRVCEGRNELVDPIHVNGYGLKPDQHWEYAYAACAARYDMGKVRQVFIYGDAAPWIAKGADVFPGAVPVLDDYHFRKRIGAFAAGSICGTFAQRARSYVMQGNRDAFQNLVYEMGDAVLHGIEESKARRDRLRHIRENGAFLLTHWDAVQNRRNPESIGSCTEALISHVFPERFSRSPMGWSKAGLAKMSMIRVFIVGGGKALPSDIGQDRRGAKERTKTYIQIEKYESLVRKQQAEIFSGAMNWRWFEHEQDIISQKRDGTRHALRLAGKMRDIS